MRIPLLIIVLHVRLHGETWRPNESFGPLCNAERLAHHFTRQSLDQARPAKESNTLSANDKWPIRPLSSASSTIYVRALLDQAAANFLGKALT